MAEKNEKLGMLLLFDVIAVLISTFGVLFVFQAIQQSDEMMNLLIVSCFFAGIKILGMGIADLTGLSRRIWVALIFIVVADILCFGINRFMAFGIRSSLILMTTAADIVIVLVAHIIWKKFFGASYEEARERSDWLNAGIEGDREEDDVEEDEEAMYHAILNTLEEKDGYTDEIRTDEVIAATEVVENETAAAVDDEDTYLDEEAFKNLLISDDDLRKAEAVLGAQNEAEAAAEDEILEEEQSHVEEIHDDEELLDTSEEEVSGESEPAMDADTEAEELETEEVAAEEDNTPFDESETVGTAPTLADLLSQSEEKVDESETESRDDLTNIEKRLSNLLNEINVSSKSTENLQKSVSAFKNDLDNLMPITTDKDILKTGDVIRGKLKNIIDRQFVVDEVLNDLIQLSEQINKRIDDLDAIEADLNRRRELLDQKEIMYMHRKPVDFEDVDVEILPDEVMLESEDSEIIIDSENLEAIKKYLDEHPEI